MVELVAMGGFLGPLANGLEHLALDLDTLVTRGGMVQGAEDVIDDFVDRNAGVLPGVDDARDGVGYDGCRHATRA